MGGVNYNKFKACTVHFIVTIIVSSSEATLQRNSSRRIKPRSLQEAPVSTALFVFIVFYFSSADAYSSTSIAFLCLCFIVFVTVRPFSRAITQ